VGRGCFIGCITFFAGFSIFGACPRMKEELTMESSTDCEDLGRSVLLDIDRYAAAHNRYPDSLQALVPRYLKALPECPNTHDVFSYGATDKDHFSLTCEDHKRYWSLSESSARPEP
jgi:hypothetical protein